MISRATRRLVLWRDASAILFGIIAFVLVAQLALSNGSGETAGNASGAASGLPSDVALGTTASPGDTILPTIGLVINPSLIPGIEPTPAPVLTPTPRPVATPRPTPRPTAAPTRRPTAPPATAGPTATPARTPGPTPSASLACNPPTGLTVTCTVTPLYAVAGADWEMGGPGKIVSINNSTWTVTWAYDASGTYTVRVTVTGQSGGTASDSTSVNV